VNDTAPIRYVDMAAQFAEQRDEIMARVEAVLAEGKLVGGPDIEILEKEVAEFCGVAHAVALNSGTDALALGMMALGIGAGDEVILPPNSFIASAAAVATIGATPVFADVRDDLNMDPEKVEAAITPQTKAIMPVHLTGRIADMTPLAEIAKRNGLLVIEDASQSFGSRYEDRLAGSFGDVGCFSAHPLKNFNAAGDSGFLTTDNGELAEKVARMGNHGLIGKGLSESFGHVSRMDTLQAAILRYKLEVLPGVIERRRGNAALYGELLDPAHVFMAPEREVEFNTYHTFVIQVDRRDELKAYLAERQIRSAIHYPVPIHLQPAASHLGHKAGDFPMVERQAERILSLPVYQNLTQDELRRVADAANGFFG
jgi:dTDP-4-amino-4,6-dideoxygalactose transaminase|tara:strand:- start:2803 stop:3912 length:1110 start_codon:yes stop_codon:yes gene_type:complete